MIVLAEDSIEEELSSIMIIGYVEELLLIILAEGIGKSPSIMITRDVELSLIVITEDVESSSIVIAGDVESSLIVIAKNVKELVIAKDVDTVYKNK